MSAQHTSAANMTACPSTDARLLLADVLQTLSDAAGSIDPGAGVDLSSATSLVTGSEALIRRASRVPQEVATEVAEAMFLRREGGPHPSGVPPVADFPTPEEIVAGQAAVAAAIGEKGSEQRARACPHGHVRAAVECSPSGLGWSRQQVWASVAVTWLGGSSHAGGQSGSWLVHPILHGDAGGSRFLTVTLSLHGCIVDPDAHIRCFRTASAMLLNMVTLSVHRM